MRVSILMASNGGVARTMQGLASLAQTVPESVPFEVVFVDNGSSDGTSAALSNVGGDFVVIRNETDAGFEAACAQAATAARGEIVVVFPPDVIALPGWLLPLLATLEKHADIQSVRPKVAGLRDDDPANRCVALRHSDIAELLASPVTESERATAGQTILANVHHAHLVPESVVACVPTAPANPRRTIRLNFPPLEDVEASSSFLANITAEWGPGSEPFTSECVEQSPLTEALMDGARPATERAVAGTVLLAWGAGEAVAAVVRRVVEKLGPDDQARVGSLLDPQGWRSAWRQAVNGAHVNPELFSHVRGPCAEYSQVVADLQLLNDVLAGSALAGRYWMIGGMLIGWAREGDLLRHDLNDFDFAFRDEDLGRFRSAMVDVVSAGFLPRYRYPSVFEPFTEFSVARHGAKFEFFRMHAEGPDKYRYQSCGNLNGAPVRNTHVCLRQRLVPIDYLDRLWLKSEDHELELGREYGNWRTPDPEWTYMGAYNIVAREPWGNPGAVDLLGIALS